MTELPITGDRLPSIWWAIAWRGFAGSVANIFVMELAAMYAGANWQEVIRVVMLIFLAIWGFLVVGMALRAKYKSFRIVLIPVEPPV